MPVTVENVEMGLREDISAHILHWHARPDERRVVDRQRNW
jgi:hypothetical protein